MPLRIDPLLRSNNSGLSVVIPLCSAINCWWTHDGSQCLDCYFTDSWCDYSLQWWKYYCCLVLNLDSLVPAQFQTELSRVCGCLCVCVRVYMLQAIREVSISSWSGEKLLAIHVMPKFCRQYVHCLKVTSRHFIYYLSVLKEQKEVFQISFYVYCTLTEVKKEEKKKEEKKKRKKEKKKKKETL